MGRVAVPVVVFTVSLLVAIVVPSVADARITVWTVEDVQHTVSWDWHYRPGELNDCDEGQPSRHLGQRVTAELISFRDQEPFGLRRARIDGRWYRVLIGGIRYVGGVGRGLNVERQAAGPVGSVHVRTTYRVSIENRMEQCGVVGYQEDPNGGDPVPRYGPLGTTFTLRCDRQDEFTRRWRILSFEGIRGARVELSATNRVPDRCPEGEGVDPLDLEDSMTRRVSRDLFKQPSTTVRFDRVATAPSPRTRGDVVGRQETHIVVKLRRGMRNNSCHTGDYFHPRGFVCTL